MSFPCSKSLNSSFSLSPGWSPKGPSVTWLLLSSTHLWPSLHAMLQPLSITEGFQNIIPLNLFTYCAFTWRNPFPNLTTLPKSYYSIIFWLRSYFLWKDFPDCFSTPAPNQVSAPTLCFQSILCLSVLALNFCILIVLFTHLYYVPI